MTFLLSDLYIYTYIFPPKIYNSSHDNIVKSFHLSFILSALDMKETGFQELVKTSEKQNYK